MNAYRYALLLTLGASLVGLAGCTTSRQESSTLSSADQTFLENAAQGSYAEIRGSELAQDKTRSADVKAFAAAMIRDHTAANQRLAALAARKGYTPPTEPSVMQRAEITTLRALSGNAFDKMYVDRIGVAAHKATIEQFETAAASAQDRDVRAFARKLLPTLRHHLEMAEALNQAQKSQ